jgi:hypothetical protein
VSSYNTANRNYYHPAQSSAYGLAALYRNGDTPAKPIAIPENVDEQSSELLLSPEDIIRTADDFKFGPEPESFFTAIPEPEEFLNRTKDLSVEILNAPLQLKTNGDGNITFNDFLGVKEDSFAIPYYKFNTPYATNGFSQIVNAISIGSHIVGTPNYFAEAEFWQNAPLSGFDGNKYDFDLITKPFSEVGRPKGLNGEDFAQLVQDRTPSSPATDIDTDNLIAFNKLNTTQKQQLLKDLFSSLSEDYDSITGEQFLAWFTHQPADEQAAILNYLITRANEHKKTSGSSNPYVDYVNSQSEASIGDTSNNSLYGNTQAAQGLYGLTGQQAKIVGDTSRWIKAYKASNGQTTDSLGTSATASDAFSLSQFNQLIGEPDTAIQTESTNQQITALNQQVTALTKLVNQSMQQIQQLTSALHQALMPKRY